MLPTYITQTGEAESLFLPELGMGFSPWPVCRSGWLGLALVPDRHAAKRPIALDTKAEDLP